jgi:hypothetical protein
MNDLSVYNSVKGQIKTGDWIGWKSSFTLGQTIGLPIRIWQWLRYGLKEPVNHISLAVSMLFEGKIRRFILESTVTDEFNGVRLRLLSERLQGFSGEVFWYELMPQLDCIRPCLDNVLQELLDQMENAPIKYDATGCVGNLWSRSEKNEASYYCSEAGYMLLEDAATRFVKTTQDGCTAVKEIFEKANRYLGGMAPMPGDAPNLGLFLNHIKILGG